MNLLQMETRLCFIIPFIIPLLEFSIRFTAHTLYQIVLQVLKKFA